MKVAYLACQGDVLLPSALVEQGPSACPRGPRVAFPLKKALLIKWCSLHPLVGAAALGLPRCGDLGTPGCLPALLRRAKGWKPGWSWECGIPVSPAVCPGVTTPSAPAAFGVLPLGSPLVPTDLAHVRVSASILPLLRKLILGTRPRLHLTSLPQRDRRRAAFWGSAGVPPSRPTPLSQAGPAPPSWFPIAICLTLPQDLMLGSLALPQAICSSDLLSLERLL